MRDVYVDLIEEGEGLDQLVAGLGLWYWSLPTPAPGWQIAHQVAHLASTARLARISATDRAAFQAMTAGTDDFDAVVDELLQPHLVAELPYALLARWRTERAGASQALAALDPDQMVPWEGRQIPARVLASIGLMELFAHGQDIADTMDVKLERTDRIRHLVALAVRNRDFGYLARGLMPPDEPFRFELKAPSGEMWEYGPASAEERVTGPAVDFCLLVTRRRHHADLALTASGPVARHWLDIAQCYRGTVCRRSVRQFARSAASPA